MGFVLMNKKFVSREAALIDIEDRGYQFGDGIYEVAGVNNGRIFKMDEHLSRLVRSAHEIGMTLPYDVEIIKSKLLELYALDPIQDGMIYFQVSRGVAPRMHHFPPTSIPAQLVAYTKKLDRPFTLQQEGVRCICTEDIRWLRCDIKSLNLLGNVLAKQKAIDNHAYEAILHRGETITEGSSTNVFIVKDNVIYTHPVNQFILNGITRQTVLDLCEKLNYSLIEETFSIQKLFEADEVFISGTFIDVVPVIEVDGKKIGRGNRGLITTTIQKEFEQLINNL
jgi:D-alanine transaminase